MAIKLALNTITFNASDTAVVRGEDHDGHLLLPIYVTRLYVEDTWGLRFTQSAVRERIATEARGLEAMAVQAHAAGRRELIIDDLSRTSWTNVPVN